METWSHHCPRAENIYPNNEIHVSSEIPLYLTQVQSPVQLPPPCHILLKLYGPQYPYLLYSTKAPTRLMCC